MKVFSVPDSRIVSGISFHTVGAACRKARWLKLVLRGGRREREEEEKRNCCNGDCTSYDCSLTAVTDAVPCDVLCLSDGGEMELGEMSWLG